MHALHQSCRRSDTVNSWRPVRAVCVRNGVHASAADSVPGLLLRLASVNIVATTRLARLGINPGVTLEKQLLYMMVSLV